MSEIYVVKLGGSVQKTKQDFYDNCVYILKKIKAGNKVIPVVSAPYGVTDMLKKTLEAKKNTDGLDKFNQTLDYLKDMHLEIFGSRYEVEAGEQMAKLMKAFKLNQRAEFITSGEDYSGLIHRLILQDLGKKARYIDGFNAGIYSSQDDIDVLETFTRGKLENIVLEALNEDEITIIGGYRGVSYLQEKEFVAKLPDNSTDETAVLAAAAAEKKGRAIVEMLKDVPGIKEVNFPGIDAKTIQRLSYWEAIEIATNGAEIIYPSAVKIARRNDLPIIVKARNSEGTLISELSGTSNEKPYAAMSVEKRCQINLVDPEMISGPKAVGYSSKVTSVLSVRGIDIKHTPDSAETITLTINPKDSIIDGIPVKEVLESALGNLDPEISARERYLVSIVGENMRKPRTLEQIANILGQNNVSIKSLSQPEEDVAVPSITIGLETKDVEKAVKALYEELFLKERLLGEVNPRQSGYDNILV